jgi:hypothetical protein
MIGNDVFRGDLAKFGMVWQSGWVTVGLLSVWIVTVWRGLFHIRVYRILSLRPSFGVGRGILNKGVMKCGGRRKSEDMT